MEFSTWTSFSCVKFPNRRTMMNNLHKCKVIIGFALQIDAIALVNLNNCCNVSKKKVIFKEHDWGLMLAK